MDSQIRDEADELGILLIKDKKVINQFHPDGKTPIHTIH